MNLMKMRPAEYPVVDVTAPYRSLIFPVLELILITGLAWIGIGYLDAHGFEATVRNAVVVLWVILVLWRFVLPVYRARRRRFILTTTRIIARTGKKIDSIPLSDVVGVRRRRGGISLAIRGYDRALYFPDLPRTKRIERAVASELEQYSSPLWR